MPYKPPASASQYRFITYYHALSCTIIMNKEHYILFCLSCSIIIVFKQKKKKKRKLQILPCQRYSVNSVQFLYPSQIQFPSSQAWYMVKYHVCVLGGGGGGGGGTRHLFLCSNLTCSPTHDKVPPVFRSIELT